MNAPLSPLSEWLASGADPDLFALNVRSLSGDAPYPYLLYEINAASGKAHPDAQWRWARKRYSHIEHGGWWCHGLDPLNNWQPMQWGCFKPNQPRNSFDPNGKIKPVKYEHPPKTPTRAFFLQVPDHIWVKVAERYGVPINPDTPKDREGFGDLPPRQPPQFWEWVWLNNIPIILVEGVKKAACLLTMGYAAIALPGITGGVRTKNARGEKCDPCLIPELQHFATPGREIYIGFDRDSKRSTVLNVNREIAKLGRLFTAAQCPVRVITLPGPEKGIDDFVVARGEDALIALKNAAPGFQFWQDRESWFLTYPASYKLNSRYLGELPYPQTGLACIKSAKGTGKTRSLARLVSDALNTGSRRVLVITHRIQLGRAICTGLGINYIDETKSSPEGELFGYGLCVDSLHPQSMARFNPEDWEGAIVIIDECEQVIWHALNSSTCRENRVAILQTLLELIRTALTTGGLVIAQDADLSDYSIDYLRALAGIPIPPWVAVNDWKPPQGRDVTFYATPNPAPLFAQIARLLSQEVTSCDLESRALCCPLDQDRPRIMIVEDSQKVKGKWSCRNLETQLQNQFPDKRILRIDSESVTDPNHPACGCVENLNATLQNYDIIIASPTIGTGVSIDIRGYFTAVFGIFKGAIAVSDALQALARVRDENVPIFVWAAPFGIGKIGNGNASYRAILASQQKVIKTNIRLLQSVDFDIDAAHDPIHLRTWAQMAARINAGMWHYREAIRYSLKAEGHQVKLCRENQLEQLLLEGLVQQIVASALKNWKLLQQLTQKVDARLNELTWRNVGATLVQEEAKLIQQENRIAEAQAVADAPDMTLSEYLELKDKRSKTPGEFNQERKYQLQETYGVPITPELKLKDDDGWLPQIRLHYYLTHDPEFVRKRDKNHLAGHLERGHGKVCPQDLRFLVASVEALKKLGVMEFLNPDREYRGTDPEVIAFAQRVKQCSADVKDFLGLSVHPDAKPMEVVQYVLRIKLGLALRRVRQERSEERDALGRHKRIRVYQFQFPQDGRQAIFAAWQSRDEEAISVAEAEVPCLGGERGGTGSDKSIGISGGVPCPGVTGSDVAGTQGVSPPGRAEPEVTGTQGVLPCGTPESCADTASCGIGFDKQIGISGSVPPSEEAALARQTLKVGAVVRFVGEVHKYVVKAVSGAQVMVKSLLSGTFVHTYARCLELADGGTG